MAKTLQEKIAVMQAAAEGKKIQIRRTTHPDERWVDSGGPVHLVWNWDEYDYRVKREPREWYVNVYSDGSFGQMHPTKEDAERRLLLGVTRKEIIKVREVIE